MSSLILVSNAFDPNHHSKFKEFIVKKPKPSQKCMIRKSIDQKFICIPMPRHKSKKIYQKMIFNRSKKGINKQIFETNNGIDNFVKKSFAAAGI